MNESSDRSPDSAIEPVAGPAADPDVEPTAGPTATQPTPRRPVDPLSGVTLEMMLTELVNHFGWVALGERIKIRCFNVNPSIKSSLQFLRRTPWAREKVEEMYRYLLRERGRQERRR